MALFLIELLMKSFARPCVGKALCLAQFGMKASAELMRLGWHFTQANHAMLQAVNTFFLERAVCLAYQLLYLIVAAI